MKKKKKYQGVVIPAVTPLTANHTLDEHAVETMFDWFRSYEAMPFILGTTGEAASLSTAVKHHYIRLAARLKAAGETLYAGVSSNCLSETVEMAKHCFDEGVDVVVATVPTYYALTPDQMKTYFGQLADSIPGPLIIYNIPTTTHMSVPLEVIDSLSTHPNIVGTKDSERGEERLKASLALWANREDFSHFLGWAAKSADALINGGDGVVPSTGNFSPGIYRDIYTAAEAGDNKKALELQVISDQLGNLYQSGRLLNSSLATLKIIMQRTGLCDPYLMPPLTRLTAAEEAKVLLETEQAIKQHPRYFKNN
ncbi:MAG TPA: dihydrodipicolinate synthase family protein [Chitinophagaceae bacterium]|jgi:4-hydroxy-tetrahydrodipicolinate synthase